MARPSKHKNERKGSGRRVPPPEQTGNESRYLQEKADAGASVVLCTSNGERFEGIIESQDADMILLRTDSGTPIRLRKSDIRYLFDAADS